MSECHLNIKSFLSLFFSSLSLSLSLDIPASVKPFVQEAQDFLCKAESKKDSDLTLAKMNYSRAASKISTVLIHRLSKFYYVHNNIIIIIWGYCTRYSVLTIPLVKMIATRHCHYCSDSICNPLPTSFFDPGGH